MSYTSPVWKQSALVTIDTQNDFTLQDAPAKIEGTLDVVPNIRELLSIYRQHQLPIIHVIRLYKEDGSNVDICRREVIENGLKIAAPDTFGAQLVNDLTPSKNTTLHSDVLLKGEFQSIGDQEWVMYKSRWGAFYKANLEQFLRDRNVETIVFSGCNFPNCPRTSIYEASERDFRVVMVEDAISQVYEKGIDEMKNIGVNVLKTADVQEIFLEQKGR